MGFRYTSYDNSPPKETGRPPLLPPAGLERLKRRVKVATRTGDPVMQTADFPGILLEFANEDRAAQRRPLFMKKPSKKTQNLYIKKINAHVKRVDPTDARRARALQSTWPFAYMASYLAAYLVDVNAVAARARNMANCDETTLALSNQSVTVERAVCDKEVLKEMRSAKRAVKKVSHQGQKQFLRVKCLFTGFANGASTAPVIWLRCLPEGTVWEPFLTDDRGELRLDDHGKLLPGRHYCPVMLNLCCD